MAYPTQKWVLSNPRIGVPLPTQTDLTALFPAGTRMRFADPVLGECEFIYLAGIASTVKGQTVFFNNNNQSGTPPAVTLATAGSRGACAIAMADTPSTVNASAPLYYGWFQIAGNAIVKSATVAANAFAFATSTAGTIDDAVVAGDKIDGITFKTADGATFVDSAGVSNTLTGYAVAMLNFPAMNGTGAATTGV